MTENNEKQTLWEKIKNTKSNRAAVLTAMVLVAAVTIVVGVTIASNRAKQGESEETTGRAPVVTDATTDTPTTHPVQTERPTMSTTPADTGSSSVENKLPSFILPVSGVLSVKHDAANQVYSTTLKDHRVHLGIDIVTSEQAPVYAAADGKVDRIWVDPMMGQCLAIKHGGESYSIYKNLSESLAEGIKEGVSVRSGQLIGTVGESAMVEVAQEPHLHFEMTVGDLLVDPLEYFDEKSLEALQLDASYGE